MTTAIGVREEDTVGTVVVDHLRGVGVCNSTQNRNGQDIRDEEGRDTHLVGEVERKTRGIPVLDSTPPFVGFIRVTNVPFGIGVPEVR